MASNSLKQSLTRSKSGSKPSTLASRDSLVARSPSGPAPTAASPKPKRQFRVDGGDLDGRDYRAGAVRVRLRGPHGLVADHTIERDLVGLRHHVVRHLAAAPDRVRGPLGRESMPLAHRAVDPD